jgi:anti-anti-sigma factor
MSSPRTHSFSSNTTHTLLRTYTSILNRTSGRAIASALEHTMDFTLPVLIDLSAVEHIDAAGLSVIYDWAVAAKGAGGDLILCAPSKKLRAMLQLVRFDEYCRIATTFAEAEGFVSELTTCRSSSQQLDGPGRHAPSARLASKR